MNWKAFLLTGALVLAGAAAAQARDTCSERIAREELKLRRDIERHGLFSRQAEYRREEIRRLRQQCTFAFDRRGRDGFWRGGQYRRFGFGNSWVFRGHRHCRR